MLCRPVLHKLLKYDKLILVCFWVFYATAATTWIIFGALHPPAVPVAFSGRDVFPHYHLCGALLILIMTLVFPMLLLRDWLFRRRTEKGMREMVEGVSASVGKVFFHSLVKHLSQALEADYVLIGRLSEKDPSRMATDAVFAAGIIQENFTAGLAGTPFEGCMHGKEFSCPCHVRRLFPRDRILGEWEVESFAGTPLFDSAGKPMGTLAVLSRKPFKDRKLAETLLRVFAIRAAGELERKQAEEAIREQSRFYQTILNAIPTPVFYKDPQSIYLGCNAPFENIIGLPKDKIIGRRIYDIVPTKIADRHQRADSELLLGGEGTAVYETSLENLEGERRHVLFHKSIFRDAAGNAGGLVGTLVDITDQKKAEETARYLAHFDSLTRLPNQLLFTDRLNLGISHAHRLGQELALFTLDLDHFKKINTAFGHHVGDELLGGVARRLSESLREDDTVAKMGGDSFTLLLPSIQQAGYAAKIAKKLLDELQRPFSLNDREIFITASIGIAIYPADGTLPHELLQNADTALHRAKEQGRSQYQFYSPLMNVRAQEQMSLETHLRRALVREELTLYYQPQVDAATGALTGAEALLRWNHPVLGMVLPADFIPLAEETGLILPIGDWVLRTACRQAKRWQEQGFPDLRIAVNLSPRQFQQEDFLFKIDAILAETGLEPACLGVEITESAVMEDVVRAADLLKRLKARGVHVSIDDFGTGYSSLGYLKRFPIDMLKIDRSFVVDLPTTPDDVAIVTAVIAMAHNLNIKTLAEGVQNERQHEFLRQQRCDELQGFLFNKPLPAEEFSLHYWPVSPPFS